MPVSISAGGACASAVMVIHVGREKPPKWFLTMMQTDRYPGQALSTIGADTRAVEKRLQTLILDGSTQQVVPFLPRMKFVGQMDGNMSWLCAQKN